MNTDFFEFESSLWIRNNGVQKASRYFFTLPKELSKKIRILTTSGTKNPGGMIKVQARIGRHDWTTSIFRDKKTGTYMLPVKAQVRKDLQLKDQDLRTIEISLI